MGLILIYNTVSKTSDSLYKEKGSKFIGYAFPISNIDEVKDKILILKKEHSSAGHFCYGYKVGVGNDEKYRFNDDGEPSNSAGKPIYGQILSHELTNVLIVVVRYFGGTKLGVGGLISAYKESAKLSIANNKIIEKEVTKIIDLQFEYDVMPNVMSLVKKYNTKILLQDFNLSCLLKLEVSLKCYNQFVSDLNTLKINLK